MQRLIIKNLGPIEECSIEVKDFLLFTGPQASGKSTIAKSIYFFNNLKKSLYEIYQKYVAIEKNNETIDFQEALSKEITNKFRQSFNLYTQENRNGYVTYEYSNQCILTVSFFSGGEMDVAPNQANIGSVSMQGISVHYSKELKSKLSELNKYVNDEKTSDSEAVKEYIYNDIFLSDMQVVYIPAGRSMLTSLSSQISYLYSVMDDRIKARIDYCTQQFIERVLLLKEYFNKDYNSILEDTLGIVDYEIDRTRANQVVDMMKTILGGVYRVENGEERLYYDDHNYVKINYASSGQQEVLWIINILFYYMLGKEKTCFIIEEPESHLFPEMQKAVVELITLVKNGSNKVIITTHSPYVLGSINNLLYAKNISKSVASTDVERLINQSMWLDYDSTGAYFIDHGRVESITNEEYQDIDHDVIDAVSGTLNKIYDDLTDLRRKGKE